MYSTCRHTLPNERLLQLVRRNQAAVPDVSSYPSKRKASTTLDGVDITAYLKVVIPLRMNGFYNEATSVCTARIELSYRSE